MCTVEFAEATRVATNPLAGLERRCLIWMAGRLPRWVTSDGLTALALAAMALTGVSYARSPDHPAHSTWRSPDLDSTGSAIASMERSPASAGNSGLVTVFTSITSSIVSACSSSWRASPGPAT